jgi:DHA2 family multidrug resistance protein
MAESLSPFSFGLPLSGASDMLDSSTTMGQGMLEGLVMREATIISYSNDYLLMFGVTLLAIPLVFLLRKPRGSPATPAPAVHAD